MSKVLSTLRHTKTDRVFGRLRDMIIDLELKPGEPVRKDGLTQLFDVSRAPINEALTRLQAEDLVVIAPQHGTFVQHIRLPKLREGIFFRRAIEPKAMALLAKTIDDARLDRLSANIERQRVAASAHDISALHRLDDAFHELLLEDETFQYCQTVMRTFSAHLERARNMASPTTRKPAETVRDHANIVNALQARDPAWAESAMDNHLASSFRELNRAMRETPELFETDGAAAQPRRAKR